MTTLPDELGSQRGRIERVVAAEAIVQELGATVLGARSAGG